MRDGWVGGAWVSGGGVRHERFCWPAVLHFFLVLFIYLFLVRLIIKLSIYHLSFFLYYFSPRPCFILFFLYPFVSLLYEDYCLR